RIGTCFDAPYHRFGSRRSTVLPRTMMRILTTNQREEWTRAVQRAKQLFVVKMPDGEVISGGLFTLCNGIVQYHLGGTRNTALKLSPTVLIFDTVRRWSPKNGAHT